MEDEPMAYPSTGKEVYLSLNLSNTMLTGIGKGEVAGFYVMPIATRVSVSSPIIIIYIG